MSLRNNQIIKPLYAEGQRLLLSSNRFSNLRRIFVLAFVLSTIFPEQAISQWHLNGNFPVPTFPTNSRNFATITAVYFLDLPGPPRIGFVGIATESPSLGWNGEVWKTTDGGLKWKQVGPITDSALFGGAIVDFTFKDSLTGWAASQNPYSGCFKTTDGGETWNRVIINLPSSESYSIYFHAATNRLFLSLARMAFGQYSTDEGTTWQSLNVTFSSCAFADDSNGILAGTEEPGTIGDSPNSITTDGGITWTQVAANYYCVHPLVVKGTGTYFILDYLNCVRRSDDGGLTWRTIYQFPDTDILPHMATTEQLFGDLKTMVAQTRDGVFISRDEGVSWESICGPDDNIGGNGGAGLYVKDGYIYAAELNYPNEPAKLWLNTTGLAAGPAMCLHLQTTLNNFPPPRRHSYFFASHSKTISQWLRCRFSKPNSCLR